MLKLKSVQSSVTQDKPPYNSFLTHYNSLQLLPIQNNSTKQKITKSKNKKLKVIFKQFNQSNWTLRQNISYMNFLKQNYFLFETENKFHRSIKINVLVSQVVKTRSSDQCRSHHQKMMRRHKNIAQIISYFENLSSHFYEKQDKHSVQSKSQDQNQIAKQIADVANAYIYTETAGIQDYLCEYVQDNIWWDGQQL